MRRKVQTPQLEPDVYCCVCGRVMWGEWQALGFGKYRHVGCAPGTPDWCESYALLPTAQKTEAGDMLYAHATKGESNG